MFMLRNRISHTLAITTALVVSFAALGVSTAAATPKGEYAVFAQCPLSNPELVGCLVSRTESGHITINTTEVPIVKTQTLQGGFEEIEATHATPFVGAADGETLSKTPQKVPGGLLDLVKCNEIKGEGFFEKLERGACELIFENKTTGVNATTELAAPASSIGLNEFALLTESGTALSLPVKVKLENPLLGNECYIGSNSSPIVINLTSGTSGSVKGKAGKLSSKAEGGILVIKENTLVNNTFSAPKATGCGEFFSFLLDPIINGKLGLPSGEGKNTAVLNNTIEQATARLVRASEEE
jgi:hypothetical protein